MQITLTVPFTTRKCVKWITLFLQWHNVLTIMIDPNDLLLFARIAETGSFSKAAARLDLPRSTVSRRIAQLEATLGERLLQRTTRSLVLTEFGASLLEHARQVVEQVEAVGALATERPTPAQRDARLAEALAGITQEGRRPG